MEYDQLVNLKQNHPALRLLAADNAPLIVSFLYRQFIESNQRSLRHSDLVSRLDDYLYHLRELYGDDIYPGPPGTISRSGQTIAALFA